MRRIMSVQRAATPPGRPLGSIASVGAARCTTLGRTSAPPSGTITNLTTRQPLSGSVAPALIDAEGVDCWFLGFWLSEAAGFQRGESPITVIGSSHATCRRSNPAIALPHPRPARARAVWARFTWPALCGQGEHPRSDRRGAGPWRSAPKLAAKPLIRSSGPDRITGAMLAGRA